jgi:copper chaperone
MSALLACRAVAALSSRQLRVRGRVIRTATVAASQAEPVMRLRLKGLRCEGCVETVTAALSAVGATGVSVSLEKQEATASGVAGAALVAAVKAAGFQAELL